MSIDLNVIVPEKGNLETFVRTAKELGLEGFASTHIRDGPVVEHESGISLYSRTDLRGGRVGSLRKQARKARRNTMILAVNPHGIGASNWAAEDALIDLLTVTDVTKNARMRGSTASLAATAGTALEIPISPLLETQGLARSKIIKRFREDIATAQSAGMDVVLTSSATDPFSMRGTTSMMYVAHLLGLEREKARLAVIDIPQRIVERNSRKLSESFVAPGIEIVSEGDVE